MNSSDIDVRYEPGHETPTFHEGRPMLTWGVHPVHGNGWTLSYLEPDGNGVEEHFIPGDLTDVDYAVRSAVSWLERVYDAPAEPGRNDAGAGS